ncbi:NAD(P)-dependent alcohol dehydrogenase [Pacificoceanicola onchidii]|uniref:NAD(P)-dependent alcohol dehydrogenase n=1 Tax=Pacificoceanicola onchidii TaxID=2562685 RepID=UPI0010A5826B|nr:NAD(P)-dependent alcohol dehydrogenase [Pacificoceanicola onchidii]
MKAAVYDRFGPADVVTLAERPTPSPAPDEILVRVGAAAVTTADWRIRAAAFPGITKLPGHLMFGFRTPKQPVLGVAMAGTVIATGHAVTRFKTGGRVFGFVGHGGHAEYVAVKEDAAVVATPDALSDTEAASLPFGGNSALVFLRDVAKLQRGQHVLIVGASGAVGSFAVQIAKAMGAVVTAVAGPGRADMLTALGADRVIDYTQESVDAARGAYDVVFDTVGVTHWGQMRHTLKPGGVFVPLNMAGRELWDMIRAKLTGGPRVALAVSSDTAEDLTRLTGWIAEGRLRPVVDHIYPFERIFDAYRQVESRHSTGTVVLEMNAQTATALSA